ncbi:MAG: 3-isopropylmalate dehydrogenase, partial [Candidatus Competibacteraceae bacterium]|nr:3-isopropylmalate dehydrogenase [Candidatus Competibacteraceae bacterium]
MTKQLLILAGDGIGPEIVAEAVKVLEILRQQYGLAVSWDMGLIGGAAYEATGKPLPDETVAAAQAADAVLLGAVGGPRWDRLDRPLRPESGLLAIRGALGLFANLRPAILYAPLAGASTLHPELVADLDIMIVRELTGGIYFGQPRGIRTLASGEREGYNTMVYRESEVERIMRVACDIA